MRIPLLLVAIALLAGCGHGGGHSAAEPQTAPYLPPYVVPVLVTDYPEDLGEPPIPSANG